MTRRGGINTAFDADKLRELIRSSGFNSIRAFALEAGVAPAQLSRAMRRGSCRAEVLNAVEDTLGVYHGYLFPESESKNRPRYWRRMRGLSVNQLSERSGISTAIIHRLERGADCYAFSAACLAKALRVPMGVYLGYED